MRVLAAVLFLLLLPGGALADERPADALDALRGRFREGIEKYHARAFADAVVIWESIYRELGPEKGYRVAFDLGRAYDELGQRIKAAEHFQAYLDHVSARRRDGEDIEANVQAQEAVARERLEQIARDYGAIRVVAGKRPTLARLDNTPGRMAGFTAYVEPGEHLVTFGSGTGADVRRVTVRAGELAEIGPRDEAPSIRYQTRVEHPISPTVLWVGAGVAVATLVVPAITYANALSIKSDYDSSANAAEKERLASDYSAARSNAYASIAVPAALSATVGALALWYVFGRKETRVPIPTAALNDRGGYAGLVTQF